MYLEIIWWSRGTPRSWRTPFRWSNPLKPKSSPCFVLFRPFFFTSDSAYLPSVWCSLVSPPRNLAQCISLVYVDSSSTVELRELLCTFIQGRSPTPLIAIQCSAALSSSTTSQIYGLPHQPTNHNETAVNILPTALIYMHISLTSFKLSDVFISFSVTIGRFWRMSTFQTWAIVEVHFSTFNSETGWLFSTLISWKSSPNPLGPIADDFVLTGTTHDINEHQFYTPALRC